MFGKPKAKAVVVTTVIYLAALIQTDSRYAWFETISDARRPGVSRRLGAGSSIETVQ